MTYTGPDPVVDRRGLCEATVTLDGMPARVCGARNDFATVRNARYGVEFAWPTVARIVAAGGQFRS